MMERNECVNIPLHLLREYSKSKQTKETLALAIGMKLHYRSSMINFTTADKIVAEFHVGKLKALRFMEMMRNNHDLFRVNGRNYVAIPMKSREEKTDRHGRKYTSDYCVKFRRADFKDNFSLKNIVRKIDEYLILQPINRRKREADCLINSEKNRNADGSYTSSLKNLGAKAGISRWKARRVIRRLIAQGKISQEMYHLKFVLAVVNLQTVDEYFKTHHRGTLIVNPKDGTGWVREPSRYTLEDENVHLDFQHVIWNSKNRMKSAQVSKSECIDRASMPDCDGYWAKMG